MKTMDEYRKELEKDPKARRTLKKLEKEFQEVEESLTEEELIKYGLKKPEEKEKTEKDAAADDSAAASVLDSIMRKI